MRVIELTAPRLDALRPALYAVPRPEAGEVLLRLRAASLNFLDIAVATGGIPIPRFPIVAVTDGAGEIADVGSDVSDWASGARAIPHFMPSWIDGPITASAIEGRRGLSRPGSLAQYAVVPAASLVAMPEHLTFEQAATLPIAATTAWRAVRAARIGPGSTVLLLGTGGVSLFALQFAKALGARVIITSSSDEKLRRARALGADVTINYRVDAAWDDEVLRFTGGQGADLVLETGGAETLSRSLNAAAMGGTVFVIGFLSGTKAAIDVIPVIEKALNVQGNNAGPVADLAAAAAFIATHRLQPVVDEVFAMTDATAVYTGVASGAQFFGKIAFTID